MVLVFLNDMAECCSTVPYYELNERIATFYSDRFDASDASSKSVKQAYQCSMSVFKKQKRTLMEIVQKSRSAKPEDAPFVHSTSTMLMAVLKANLSEVLIADTLLVVSKFISL